MSIARDADAQKLIEKTAKEMEKLSGMKPPEWAGFVKTGVSRERPPTQDNWWYLRAASMLRKMYMGGELGVSKFRKVYGGRKNRGHKPEHKYKSSGKIIRKILQQMESEGLVKSEKGKSRGITTKGKAFLDNVARSMKN